MFQQRIHAEQDWSFLPHCAVGGLRMENNEDFVTTRILSMITHNIKIIYNYRIL